MRQTSSLTVLLAFGCAFTQCPKARAESTNRQSAEALFVAGRASLQAGDYAAACEHFHESDALEHGLGTWLNLGLCEERLGHGVSASEYYGRVIDAAPAADARAEIARERLRALEERLPQVTLHLVESAPPDTVVSRGAVVYDAAARRTAIPLDPGVQRFTVSADGFAARAYAVTLAEGERIELELAPGSPLTASTPKAVEAARPRVAAVSADHGPDRAAAAPSSRALGWALVVTGGAALAVGAVSGGMLLHDQSVVQNDCDTSKTCSSNRALDAAAQGRVLNVVSPIASVAGVLLAGAGAFVLLSNPREHAVTRIGGRLAPGAAELDVVQAF